MDTFWIIVLSGQLFLFLICFILSRAFKYYSRKTLADAETEAATSAARETQGGGGVQPTFINHHFGGNGRHHLSDADAAFENAPPSYFEIPHDFEKKTPNLGEQQLPSYAEAVLKHKEEEEEEEEQSCQNRQYCNSDISGSNSSSFPAEYDTEVTAHVFERDTDRPNINDEDSPGYLEEGVSSITLP